MSNVLRAIAMVRSGSITGSQTVFIDDALSAASCEQIPNEDGPNVINYINLQLAHNPVSQEVRNRLARLHDELAHRYPMA